MRKVMHPIVHGLKRIRVQQRRSQESVASQANWGASQLVSYEGGKNVPSINNLELWARALGYEIVLRRKEEPNGLYDAHSTGPSLPKAG